MPPPLPQPARSPASAEFELGSSRVLGDALDALDRLVSLQRLSVGSVLRHSTVFRGAQSHAATEYAALEVYPLAHPQVLR